MSYKSGAPPLPDGYVRVSVNGNLAIACNWAADAIGVILAKGTLHAWAAGQSRQEQFTGRGVNYGVILPAGRMADAETAVVIRRNRHGGLFRALTGEYFFSGSRAPIELANYMRLSGSGIKTPEVIAYAIYPALFNLVRCDVVTQRLPEGGDFPDIWKKSDATTRKALLMAAAKLLRDLANAGAWHADLNLKNIYIAGHGTDLTPYILDIDRVTFPATGDIAVKNFNRLARSARKWHSRWGLDFTEQDLECLAALTKEIH